MAEDSRFSRRNLSVIILVVCVFIVMLYNLPGSRKPEKVETGPLILPEQATQQQAAQQQESEQQAKPTPELESLEMIAKTKPKPHNINIESWHTANGARVMFVAAPEIPMLDIRAVFNAGAARDGELPGLANLTSAMLTEGAGSADVDEIARHFEGLGASISSGSYRDMALVSLRTLSDPQYRTPALSMFYDIVAEPSFPPASLERIRAQALLSLKHEQQSPGALAQQAFFSTLYDQQPYGSHPTGTEKSLQQIAEQDLNKFHKQYYVTSNMVVAIIGDITKAEAENIASELDKRLPSGEPAPALPKPVKLTAGKREHNEFPSSQTHIMVGGVGIERGNPDHYALSLGNEILGAGGFSSRLNKIIRQENGLAYSIYSHFSPMSVAGPFLVNMQTRNDQTQQALELVNKTLTEFMEKGPTEEELADAKRHLLGSFPLRTASNRNIVDYLGMIGFYNLPLDYLEQYPDKIAALTVQDVITAFKHHIDPEALLTVTVGQEQ